MMSSGDKVREAFTEIYPMYKDLRIVAVTIKRNLTMSQKHWTGTKVGEGSASAGVITSVAFSRTNKYLAAGAKNGVVTIFTQDDQTHGWKGTAIDQKEGTDVWNHDVQFTRVERNADMLLTLTPQRLVSWFIGEHNVLIPAPDYAPKTFEFPKPVAVQCMTDISQAVRVSAPSNGDFDSMALSSDGLNVAYIVDDVVFERRLEDMDRSPRTIYQPTKAKGANEDTTLTCVDYHPSNSNVIIVGDYEGDLRQIDMRTTAKVLIPQKRVSRPSARLERYTWVNDVKYCPNGSWNVVARYFSDIVFWDMRYPTNPRQWTQMDKLDKIGEMQNASGNAYQSDIFKIAWIDSETIATGSFWGTLLSVGANDGKVTKHYITSSGRHEGRFNFSFSSAKKRQFAVDHAVYAVTASDDGRKVAVANGSALWVYDVK